MIRDFLHQYGPVMLSSFIGAGLAYSFALNLAKRQFTQDLKLKAMFSTIDALHNLDKILDKAQDIWIEAFSGAGIILKLKDPKHEGLDIQKGFFDDLSAFTKAIEEIPSAVSPVYFYQIISEVQTEDITKDLLELTTPLEELSSQVGRGRPRLEKAKAVVAIDDDMYKAIRTAKHGVSTHLGLVNHLDLVSLIIGKRRFRTWKRYVYHKFNK